MEHAFDTLSKQLARGMSRRVAILTLLRGAVGTFLVSAGFTRFSLRAQSGVCSACGTCATLDVSTQQLTTTCTENCEAQTLCNTAQSNAPYQALVSLLTGLGFQQSFYSALISEIGKSQIQLFYTAYTNPSDSNSTADLMVVWAPDNQDSAFALQYENGSPLWGYYVNDAGTVQQVSPPPQIPAPFAISVSPSSVEVANGSPGMCTVSTTVAELFSSAIALKASGLPSGAKANFNPNPIAAPGSGSSTMTIEAGASTPIGTYPITVTGNGDGITETTTLSLTVNAAGDSADSSDEFGGTSHEISRTVVPSISSTGIHDVTNKYCPIGCKVLGAAAGYGSAGLCEAVIGAAAAAACVELGPLAGYCLVVAYGFGTSIINSCRAGVGAAAEWACEKYLCSCPPCTIAGTLGCTPMCSSDTCPSPGTCSPDGCACQPCGAGSSMCGSTCCPDYNTCCDGTCFAGTDDICCGGGFACLQGSFCCPPTCCNDEEGLQCCGGYCCLEDEECSCEGGGLCCTEGVPRYTRDSLTPSPHVAAAVFPVRHG